MTQKQIVRTLCIILVVSFVWNIVSMIMHNVSVESTEMFSCKGTYNHPTCKATFSNSVINNDSKQGNHSSQFTYLVGDNTVCNDPLMVKKSGGRLYNTPIQIGERVYASYNNKYHPATVIRVYKKGDSASMANSATTYSNSNLPNGLKSVSMLTRPNPLHFYQQEVSNAKLQNHLSSQNLSKATASNVQVSRLSVSSVDDSVDVMFDDQRINQVRVQSDQPDLRLNVDTQIRRRPQSEMIDKCAKQCVDAHPNTWGVHVGGCYSQKCKCECLVPDGSANKCRDVHRFSASDEQANFENHTHTDLHQLDSSVRKQYLMHRHLSFSGCSDDETRAHQTATQPQKQLTTACTTSYVAEGDAGEANSSSTITGCEAPCSQYSGTERELCLDKDKLTEYMNKLPTITSLGEGMCPTRQTQQQRHSDCPINHDTKCSRRLKDDCKTHKASDYYKCRWHEHDPHNALDKNGTGCYDVDKCMFSTTKSACERNKTCMWNDDKYYCTEKAYCPSSCATTMTNEQCNKNPFCRWTDTTCKIKNVLDKQELNAMIKGSSSVKYSVFEELIKPAQLELDL